MVRAVDNFTLVARIEELEAQWEFATIGRVSVSCSWKAVRPEERVKCSSSEINIVTISLQRERWPNVGA